MPQPWSPRPVDLTEHPELARYATMASLAGLRMWPTELHFNAADPRHGDWIEVGARWTPPEEDWPAWRLAWVRPTGQVIAVRLRDPLGLPGYGPVVEFGRVDAWHQLGSIAELQEHNGPGGLAWVRSQVQALTGPPADRPPAGPAPPADRF
jgi:hypothetical protein